MNWLILVLAGLCECVWATTMKLSDGFTKLPYTLVTVVGMIASFVLLARASRHIPLSVSYPVWTGIGAVGAVLLGLILFHERLNLWTLGFVVLLIVSIVGIKVSSAG
ncbi:multidrug efflux SMR transporter [Lacticaseibacillus pabuli]|uniref:Multidrug efflux SMR transporter n=1 Tax=Lacticaseibacillus pabuli TaxID=3025672 RepID=A0ABY7WUN1_9LACO|nr:multidrug efflux SMR transporter [Lacticaseibacillus sp. KACC 23028]WDF83168.1 multidrug efflux SMR transporter [Lacticaseibacillus sp. KACC 23028]